MHISRFLLIYALISFELFLPSSFCATDGVEDPLSSTGSTDLSLTVPALVRISAVSDINITYSGGATASSNDGVCIYTNDSSGQYKVTARGSGGSYAFLLSDGGSQTLPYKLKWNESPEVGGVDLTANVRSETQSNANTQYQNCGGGNTANFQVTFNQSDLMNVPAGTYTGTITFIIDPA